MDKKERINQINNELKVYINESSFISQKCRNQLLKFFAETFDVSLDISNYQNVDLKIEEDFKFLYRDDLYESHSPISSMEELEERYHLFQEKADVLIRRKEVDFQGRRNWNNFANLMVVICLFLALIGMIILGIQAFISGRYFDCLWLVVVIFPWLFPKIKSNLTERIAQAKNYLKSLLKKVK